MSFLTINFGHFSAGKLEDLLRLYYGFKDKVGN